MSTSHVLGRKAISLSMRAVLSKDVKLLMDTHTHLHTHAQDEPCTTRSAALVTWNEIGRGLGGVVVTHDRMHSGMGDYNL